MELKLEKTLDFTHELGNSITLINQPYKERDFQYLRSGSWELPPMGSLYLAGGKSRSQTELLTCCADEVRKNTQLYCLAFGVRMTVAHSIAILVAASAMRSQR